MTKKVLIFLGWQSCSLLLEICSDKYNFVHKYHRTLDQPATVQPYRVTGMFYYGQLKTQFSTLSIQFDGLKLHLNVYQVDFLYKYFVLHELTFQDGRYLAWTYDVLLHISASYLCLTTTCPFHTSSQWEYLEDDFHVFVCCRLILLVSE